MKDENIKEILFNLEIVARKHTIKVCDDGNIETIPASVVHELRLNNYSANKLLDYITNLQEEKERLKELCDKYEEEHNTAFKLWKGKLKETMDETLIQKQHDRIKELEAINEEHRKLNGNLRTVNNTLCEVEDFMYNQAKDYKARIDKAVDMLNLIIPELWNISNAMTYKIQDVRRVLQGKSDE